MKYIPAKKIEEINVIKNNPIGGTLSFMQLRFELSNSFHNKIEGRSQIRKVTRKNPINIQVSKNVAKNICQLGTSGLLQARININKGIPTTKDPNKNIIKNEILVEIGFLIFSLLVFTFFLSQVKIQLLLVLLEYEAFHQNSNPNTIE